jgi:predicted  nucleic acid-binding Zn-ribbon protein
MAELGHLREQAQEDSAARRYAEEKLEQSQRDLCAAQMHIDQLQQQNVKLSWRLRRIEKRMGHYDRDLKKIILVSQRLDSAPRIHSDDEEEGGDSRSWSIE